MISVLIPTYNYDCSRLVNEISRQCLELSHQKGLIYEIIVADDGSNDQNCLGQCRKNCLISDCNFIELKQNLGRSKVRNLLAKQAKGDYLIFIDSHMNLVSTDYILRYMNCNSDICQGGYVVCGDKKDWGQNLRFLYELHSQRLNKKGLEDKGNRDFHTSNFYIRRELFLSHPLDESISRYGYEDVLYGKQLEDSGISVTQIDNPVGFSSFEPNDSFVKKTEESLMTLHEIQDRIGDYSRLLNCAKAARKLHISPLLRGIFALTHKAMRRNLCSTHPLLFVFNLYKLLYLINLHHD